MQERLGKTVADLRIQSMKLLETEKTLREVQEEKEVTDRSRLRLESQIETQLHQISILEEKSELISKELKSWQVKTFFIPIIDFFFVILIKIFFFRIDIMI